MIHAILRLALLGYNILETFKTLKVKVRKGTTEPSSRAMAQRKRDMKGVLCVWVVCICWFMCESITDRTISYVTPFYNQIKTVILLFLIFARSKGAEPIVLNVIRPFVKPYTPVIDTALDFLSVLAAFLIDLARIPWLALLQRWDNFVAVKEQEEIEEQLPQEDDESPDAQPTQDPSYSRSSSQMGLEIQDMPLERKSSTSSDARSTRSRARQYESKPLPVVPPVRAASTRSSASSGHSTHARAPRPLRSHEQAGASDPESLHERPTSAHGWSNDGISDQETVAGVVKQGQMIINEMGEAQMKVKQSIEKGRQLRSRSRDSNRHAVVVDHTTKSSNTLNRVPANFQKKTSRSVMTSSSSTTSRNTRHDHPSTRSAPINLPQPTRISRPLANPISPVNPNIPNLPLSTSYLQTQQIHSSLSSSQNVVNVASHINRMSPSMPVPSPIQSYSPRIAPSHSYVPAPPPPPVMTSVTKDPLPEIQYPLGDPPPSAGAPLSAQSMFGNTSMNMHPNSSTSTSVTPRFDVSQLNIDAYFETLGSGSASGEVTDSLQTGAHVEQRGSHPTGVYAVNASPPSAPATILAGAPITSERFPEAESRSDLAHRVQTYSTSSSHGYLEHASPPLFAPPTPPSEYLHDLPLPEVEVIPSTSSSSNFATPLSPGPTAPGGFYWDIARTPAPINQNPSFAINGEMMHRASVADTRATSIYDFDELKRQFEAGVYATPPMPTVNIALPGHFPTTPGGQTFKREMPNLLLDPNVQVSPRLGGGLAVGGNKERGVSILSTFETDDGEIRRRGNEEEWRNSQEISIFEREPEVRAGTASGALKVVNGVSSEVEQGDIVHQESQRETEDADDLDEEQEIEIEEIPRRSRKSSKAGSSRTRRIKISAVAVASVVPTSQATARVNALRARPPVPAPFRPLPIKGHERESSRMSEERQRISESISSSLADSLMQTMNSTSGRLSKSRPPPIATDRNMAGRATTLPVSSSSASSARRKHVSRTKGEGVASPLSGDSLSGFSEFGVYFQEPLSAGPMTSTSYTTRSKVLKRGHDEDEVESSGQSALGGSNDGDDTDSLSKRRKYTRGSHLSAGSMLPPQTIPQRGGTSTAGGSRISTASREPPPLPARRTPTGSRPSSDASDMAKRKTGTSRHRAGISGTPDINAIQEESSGAEGRYTSKKRSGKR